MCKSYNDVAALVALPLLHADDARLVGRSADAAARTQQAHQALSKTSNNRQMQTTARSIGPPNRAELKDSVVDDAAGSVLLCRSLAC